MTSTKPIIRQATRLNEYTFHEAITLLLYGGSGSGKTFFAGTAGDRTLYCNLGHGLTTLIAPAFVEKYGKVNPLIIDIPLNEKAYDTLTDTLDYYIKNESDAFDTIVVDEGSALSRFAMRKGIVINDDLNKSQALNAFKKHGIVNPGVQDYGEEMAILVHFFSEYTEVCKMANKHLIILAHEKRTYRKQPNAKIGDAPILEKIRPGFTGQQFPDNIPAFFDEVWYQEVVGKGDNKKYRIKTQGDERLVAKSRYGGIFNEVETNLDWPKVLQKISEYQQRQNKN